MIALVILEIISNAIMYVVYFWLWNDALFPLWEWYNARIGTTKIKNSDKLVFKSDWFSWELNERHIFTVFVKWSAFLSTRINDVDWDGRMMVTNESKILWSGQHKIEKV